MISKKFAIDNNLTHYDDCLPCYHNHPPGRYTKTEKCVYCHREKSRVYKMSLHERAAYKCGLSEIREYVPTEDVELAEAFCASLRLDRDRSC